MRPLIVSRGQGHFPGLFGRFRISRVNPDRAGLLLCRFGTTETQAQAVAAAGVQGVEGLERTRALRSLSGSSGKAVSRTAARYPPMKMEYITASAHPTPNVKPRKKPIIEPQ